MKIRIKGNSIRLRLTKADVKNLSEKGEVTEQTGFGNSFLIYSLHTAQELQELQADFHNGQITVYIKKELADELAQTERVGVYAQQQTGENAQLQLMVEKDFRCLDPGHEDQEDNFDHPGKVCGTGG